MTEFRRSLAISARFDCVNIFRDILSTSIVAASEKSNGGWVNAARTSSESLEPETRVRRWPFATSEEGPQGQWRLADSSAISI